ncbi:MAG: DUF3054 domain-containing protein [Anaerolineales bacterium]|nr:DUF3054 domain-containing protein [Anaerolineales bacterium]
MKERSQLVLGDLVALVVITLTGFATHGEIDTVYLPRMLATLTPLVISWFLVAPWLALFDLEVASSLKSIWRISLAAFLAAPMMAVLRAAVLGTAALPLFVLVMGVSTALGMLAWRGIWLFYGKRQQG